MTKLVLTLVTLAAVFSLSGCAEKRACCNPAPVAAPAPVVEVVVPVVEVPAPVVEVAPVVEPEPIMDAKTRAVQ